MFTDMVGYSAVADRDERLALSIVLEQRKVIRDCVERFQGIEHQTTGDGFFLEFPSAVQAVQCALEIQSILRTRHQNLPADRVIPVRMGIHLGDVVFTPDGLFGGNVNVAARIEPFSEPGGVCISQQVYDQVFDKIPRLAFRRLPRRELKNIQGTRALYQIRMPWSTPPGLAERARRLRAELLRRLPAGARTGRSSPPAEAPLVLMLGGIAALIALLAWAGAAKAWEEGAKFRQASATEILSLDASWLYQPRMDEAPPTESAWKVFDARFTNKYAREISGAYWLKKEFALGDRKLKEPALLLGPVAEKHRVYVNDRFVGGADLHGDIAIYPLDRAALKRDGNVILIRAEAPASLNPGLTIIPENPPMIAEYAVARSALWNIQWKFQFSKFIFLIITAMALLGQLSRYTFGRRKPVDAYVLLLLGIGTLHLSYYTIWIESSVSFQLHRAIKLLCLTGASSVLLSGFLQAVGKPKWERAHNLAAAFAQLVLFVTLCFGGLGVERFVAVYNTVLIVSALATGFWLLLGSYHLLLRPGADRRPTTLMKSDALVFLTFGALILGPICNSIKGELASQLIPPELRSAMIDLSILSPILFALLMKFRAHRDELRNHALREERDRINQLNLDIVQLLQTSEPLAAAEAIQKKICAFLGAQRSTLYVFDSASGGRRLRAQLVYQSPPQRAEIDPALDPTRGIVGYALKHETALLINDIRKDQRFHGPAASFPVQLSGSYDSGACLIYPMYAGGKAVGVLTIADPARGRFSEEEFTATLKITALMGLLMAQHSTHKTPHLRIA